MRRSLAAGLGAALTASCAAGGPTAGEAPRSPPDAALWGRARERLEALRRRARPASPYRMRLALDLETPGGAVVRGRGALAVAAPHALRMVLLGPGGTTAMDLWVCRDAFRLGLLDRVARGDVARASAEELRGLPVALLGWWLLMPLAGSLQWADEDARGWRWLVRDSGGWWRVGAAGDRVSIERGSGPGHERLEADLVPCGVAAYERAGVRMRVRCEERIDAPPPAAAFADPDTGAPCGGLGGEPAPASVL